MTLLRALLVLGGIALVIAVAVVTFADRSGPSTGGTAQHPLPVDAALAAKAQEHCWFSVKSRSNIAKASARGPLVASGGTGSQQVGDLILVTGAIEPAVGDDRFYGCALYQYTEGSPVVIATKVSPSPLRAESLIPLGFTSDGKKQ